MLTIKKSKYIQDEKRRNFIINTGLLACNEDDEVGPVIGGEVTTLSDLDDVCECYFDQFVNHITASSVEYFPSYKYKLQPGYDIEICEGNYCNNIQASADNVIILPELLD